MCLPIQFLQNYTCHDLSSRHAQVEQQARATIWLVPTHNKFVQYVEDSNASLSPFSFYSPYFCNIRKIVNMVMLPTSQDDAASQRSLPSYHAAQGAVDQDPPAQNANVAEPAPAAAPGGHAVRVEQLIRDIEAQRRAQPVRQPALQNNPRPRQGQRPSFGKVYALLFWSICAFVTLILLGTLQPLHSVGTFCPITQEGKVYILYSCKLRTWYIMLFFTVSMAMGVDWMRRRFADNTPRFPQQCAVVVGPALVVLVMVMTFTAAIMWQGCFSGRVEYSVQK